MQQEFHPRFTQALQWFAGTVATTVWAQSPLTTTFASNNGGSVGGMVFFDVAVSNPAGVTIKQLDINTASTSGELRVYSAPGSYPLIAALPLLWNQVASGAIDAAGLNNATAVCLGAGFFLPFGNHAIALSGTTLSQRYTSGAAVPLVYANADVTLTMGAASSTPFGGTQFTPRIWNGSVHYDVGATQSFSCAYTTSFGLGCNEGATSWYETFADLSNFDLAGTVSSPLVMRATAAGAVGYVIVPGSPSWRAPVGSALRNNQAGNPGALASNQYSEPLQLPFTFAFPGGSSNVVHASANGCVLLGATSSIVDFVLPTSQALLTQAPRLAPLWCPMDPLANAASNPASGVYFDIGANGAAAYITWVHVADARTGAPPPGVSSMNVQCVLHQNGDYEFRYGVVVPGPGTGPVLVGWSKGGSSGDVPDPGSIDISDPIPWATNGPDNFALRHQASHAKLGNSLELSVHHVENVAPVAFLLVGDAVISSGVSLAAAGAPGCLVFTNVLATATVSVAAATASGALMLPIPNNPALLGARLVSQYASLTQRNLLNVTTSNAVSCTIGN